MGLELFPANYIGTQFEATPYWSFPTSKSFIEPREASVVVKIGERFVQVSCSSCYNYGTAWHVWDVQIANPQLINNCVINTPSGQMKIEKSLAEKIKQNPDLKALDFHKYFYRNND